MLFDSNDNPLSSAEERKQQEIQNLLVNIHHLAVWAERGMEELFPSASGRVLVIKTEDNIKINLRNILQIVDEIGLLLDKKD